ncbi:MAG: hypothetical protein JSU72_03220 [Deltaproteobacteria bacterium]|nr:MAG: hypothetical protein JSU72_03220 [Deltaproteobacteria bacterium]
MSPYCLRKHWVQTQAVHVLGIGERVLRYKLTKYNITKKDA